MHELGITQSVLAAITERTGQDRVVRVRLEIGRLSGVLVDAIRFCFDVVTQATPVEGAVLEIDEPPGQGRCRTCGCEFPITDTLSGCPCGGLDVELTAGEQLLIREVEVVRDVCDVWV